MDCKLMRGALPPVDATLTNPEMVPPLTNDSSGMLNHVNGGCHLKEGMSVKLLGLVSAPELNGRTGKLGKFDAASGRWEVSLLPTRLTDGVDVIAFRNERSGVRVKPKNMLRHEAIAFDDDSVVENHGAEDDATLTPAQVMLVSRAQEDFIQDFGGMMRGIFPEELRKRAEFCLVKKPQPGIVAKEGACFGGAAFRRRIPEKCGIDGYLYVSCFKDASCGSSGPASRALGSWRRSAAADRGVKPWPLFRFPKM